MRTIRFVAILVLGLALGYALSDAAEIIGAAEACQAAAAK